MRGTPYLSVVVTARNDNHGGDLLPRMQTFVNALAAQCERHAIETELIVVEWNPPGDRERLTEALDWPRTPWCEVRVIEVPQELHARIEHADRLPLFQMIAKNVGIRRARGEYVLATNFHVIFSHDLMEQIRPGRLDPRRLYRVDRLDVEVAAADLPDLPIDDVLERCAANVIRACERMGTFDLRTGAFYRIYEDQRLPLVLRRLLHIWRAFVVRFRRLLRRQGARIAAATRFVLRAAQLLPRAVARRLYLAGIVVKGPTLARRALRSQHPWRSFRFLLQYEVQQARRRRARRLPRTSRRRFALRLPAVLPALRQSAEGYREAYRRTRIAWNSERARIPLHTNASGDFTLLSRSAWERLRAYPELQIFSMHIDGLFLYQAHYGGFRETTLKGRFYHIEHTHGFKPDPEEVDTLNTRLERAAIPQITYAQFLEWITEMHDTHKPISFNDADWGFAQDRLEDARPNLVEEVAAR